MPIGLSLSKAAPSCWPRRKGRSALRQAQGDRLWLVAALAQTFPPLTGRVVDRAELLSTEQEAQLTTRLAALERATSRQLVVATVPDLQGYPVEDYGYRLGRAWGLGDRAANNGAILLVAPTDRRVRVEVGYGLEPIVTDAFADFVIRNRVLPRFRADDYAGGIIAGVDSLIEQLQAPSELAERRALEAAAQQRQRQASGGGGSSVPMIIWALVIAFIILPAILGGRRYGRSYRRRGSGLGPVILWGSSFGAGFGSGGGWSGGGGGGGGGGFGGGGFSGGGGSFGGGGASGSW